MKKGWEYKKIKDIGSVIGGTTPNTNIAEYWDGNLCWISPAELDGSHYLYDSRKKITEAAVKAKSLKLLPEGTVILSSRAPIGKVVINKVPTYCNQGFKCVVCGKEINNEFLYWWFWGKTEYLNSLGTGATFKEISKKVVEEITIPVPPLSEQQSIVDYLDSAFAKIDAMKANAEKALNEAKSLFQASLKEMLEPKEGWEEKKFGDVCWYNKKNGLHKGTRYVGMEHIEQGTGRLLCTISSDDVLSNTFAFNKGDVLYGRLRPYLKKVIVAGFEGCCSTEIFPIQSKEIISSFLMYWFLTDEITNKVNATCAGCRMPRGNMNDVLKFDISYPSISEQQSIVATLDSLKSKVDRLQENFDKISQECDALKQAILRQVFE